MAENIRTVDRVKLIDELIEKHDLFDRGTTDLESNGLAVAMLVAAFVCATGESNQEAQESLLVYVLDEASRKQHCVHLLRWIHSMDITLSPRVKEHLLAFTKSCQLKSETVQLKTLPEAHSDR